MTFINTYWTGFAINYLFIRKNFMNQFESSYINWHHLSSGKARFLIIFHLLTRATMMRSLFKWGLQRSHTMVKKGHFLETLKNFSINDLL